MSLLGACSRLRAEGALAAKRVAVLTAVEVISCHPCFMSDTKHVVLIHGSWSRGGSEGADLGQEVLAVVNAFAGHSGSAGHAADSDVGVLAAFRQHTFEDGPVSPNLPGSLLKSLQRTAGDRAASAVRC